jgi:hypothetical protein
MGEDDQNRTAAGAAEIPPEAAINETTTTMTNATTDTADISPVPDDEGVPLAIGGGEELPMGPPFPPVSSFTVTFEEPGTYTYFCAIHPWMTGQVVVQGDIATETQAQNQTETQGDTQPETQAQNQTETQGLNELESANPIFG